MFKVVVFFLLLRVVLSRKFTCLNGDLIEADEICDGQPNCSDSSDERVQLCFSIICNANEFKCYSGACITRNKVCNGMSDCLDGSDEFNCGKFNGSCDHSEFYCSSSRKCIDSSLLCNGQLDCPSGEDEDQLCQPQLCPTTTFRCNHGRCIDMSSLCDNFNDCITGDDESDFLCSHQCFSLNCSTLTCLPIISKYLEVSCTKNRRKINCSDDIEPGTRAEYSCAPFYEPSIDIHKSNNAAVCQVNGKWSRAILDCKPSCGYLKEPVQLIVNGFETDITFPWHAALYIRKDGNFTFACGATLISESFVLSAAHCFSHINEKDLKIVLGKRLTSYASNTDENITQYFDANRIIRHPLYLDRIGNFGSDIAIVELNQSVTLSDDVHPACVDWDLEDVTFDLTRNQMGFIVGMGITENETNSESVRMATIPIVSSKECIREQSKDFKKFITFTTFCAGWANGTGVCNGDSGGGLMVLSRDLKQWKVQGIVSLSPRRHSTFFCDPFKYTIFTKVGLYVRWMKSTMDSIKNYELDDI